MRSPCRSALSPETAKRDAARHVAPSEARMDAVEITPPVARAAAERLLREPVEQARLGALVGLVAEGLIGPEG